MNSTCELGCHAARALKPYPDYKTSGVQWLGKVPAHWEVAPVKQQYAIRLGKMLQPARRASDDCRISYLKAKHVQWFEVRTNDIDTMWATPDEVDRYGIVAGDLLVCEGGEGGRCGIVKHGTALPDPCIIQNALHRVRPRSWASVGDISRNDYLQYMMSTVASAGWFDVLTDKATIAHFTAEKFGALLASIPPLPEQAAIVRFLDHADRRIRRYIRAQQQLIALLEEQKQAIIHQAVTGQIDVRTGKPYQAYKPSGVEWLGDVPAHWERARLKAFLLRPMRNGLFKKKDAFGSGVPLVNVADIYHNSFQIDPASLGRVQTTPDEMSTYQVRTGDLFFVRSSLKLEGTGRSAVAIDCAADSVFECHLVQGRPDPRRAVTRFLAFQLNSFSLRHYLISRANVVTMATVSQGVLASCPVFLPSISEQEGLLKQIDGECVRVSATHDRARLEIDLLREYRTRLIADVVTGKLDVRGAAARLPDEVEELEPLAEADALIGSEEEPADALATTP